MFLLVFASLKRPIHGFKEPPLFVVVSMRTASCREAIVSYLSLHVVSS